MTAAKFKIKKGDNVIVRTGNDKGRTGVVKKILKDDAKVIVEGIRVVKKHTKPSAMNAGGIVQKELPIHISNVALVDPSSGAATKVGFKIEKDGTKVRISRKSGQAI